VPILSIFFGIIIRMRHDDHPPPHIHAAYQGFEALINIKTGKVAEGYLPKKAAKIVKEWCSRHQDELLKNWELAQRFEPLERIPGADYDD
jgi:hypothetical protein